MYNNSFDQEKANQDSLEVLVDGRREPNQKNTYLAESILKFIIVAFS